MLRKILEGENETTESRVLSEASQNRIAAGPSGAPPSSGPSGPPGAPSAGPAGPPAEPPSSDAPATEEAAEPDEESPSANEETYEPAENGYFFRKMPDGTYDQTVYVKTDDGTYVPHEG